MISEQLAEADPGETAIYEVTPPTEVYVVTMPNYRVKAFYDREAAVFYAQSEVQNWVELGVEISEYEESVLPKGMIFKTYIFGADYICVHKVVVQ